MPIFTTTVCLFLMTMNNNILGQQDSSISGIISGIDETSEYCLTEVFEASCLKNEVVVMNSAIYGRMRKGRCLEDEGDVSSFGSGPDILGCSVDVLQTFDERCSLLNRCEITIALTAEIMKKKPCHLALKNYLEASYDCVPVIDDDRSCSVSVSSNPLHVRHMTGAKLNCGTKSQPWVLEAPSGQQIQLSLLDLNYKVRDLTSHNVNCQQYGYIIDGLSQKNVSICGLTNERMKIIYQSVSHVIKIVFTTQALIGHNHEVLQMLLGFKASGCSNIVPPEDTWLSRKENEAIVGCYSSHQTWTLRCVDQQWIGVIGNCSREVPNSKSMPNVDGFVPMNNQVMFTVAIGCTGLAICAIIIVIGILCMKRYSAKGASEYNGHKVKPNTASVWRPVNKPTLHTSVQSELLA